MLVRGDASGSRSSSFPCRRRKPHARIGIGRRSFKSQRQSPPRRVASCEYSRDFIALFGIAHLLLRFRAAAVCRRAGSRSCAEHHFARAFLHARDFTGSVRHLRPGQLSRARRAIFSPATFPMWSRLASRSCSTCFGLTKRLQLHDAAFSRVRCGCFRFVFTHIAALRDAFCRVCSPAIPA